jgi:dCMP deaminase
VTDIAEAWLERAILAAARSPNQIRKVGALLVTADRRTEIAACNTFPPGIRNLPERVVGDNRFIWLEHAERSAIFEAARRGLATEGGMLVSTYFPCTDCARAIIQAGVRTVATPRPEFDDRVWGESFRTSAALLSEGSVNVVHLAEDQDRIHRRIWDVATTAKASPPDASSSGDAIDSG